MFKVDENKFYEDKKVKDSNLYQNIIYFYTNVRRGLSSQMNSARRVDLIT